MMPDKSRSNKTKRAVRVSPGLLTLCAALAIMLVVSFACGSSEGGKTGTEGSDVPNPSEKFDLSGMDAATTEAEIIRLLGEGHVMYTRQEVFARGGIFNDDIGCIEQMRSIPQVVCEGYPGTIVEEWWESTDSSGTVDAYYGRMTMLDGTVLATGIQGEWTDVASGEQWSAGRREGRELVRDVEAAFETLEKMEANRLVGTESEYLGRPSLVFSVANEYAGRLGINFDDGESEYQVANPLLRRETGWRDHDDGVREVTNETRVLDFAMIPPASLPEFAVMPAPGEFDGPNLGARFDLSGMDTAAMETEIIRLLGEGHVMYTRMERFGRGGAYEGVCNPGLPPGSMPRVVCDTYPGRIVRETWESTDSSGVVQVSYSRESKLDGTVLAIKIGGEWTDIASGETWPDGMRKDRKLAERIEGMSTVIERVYDDYPELAESEYLGKPSIIFGGVFEYQLENPLLWRQVRRQELGDGMITILSEARFTDFAMLPPGSFPDFATTSGK